MFINDIDNLSEMHGLDVKVDIYGMMDNPIGRITNITEPDTDKEYGDENYPYSSIEITVEDHLRDREWTTTGIGAVTLAKIGQTYELYFGEVRNEDGSWERITDKFESDSTDSKAECLGA